MAPTIKTSYQLGAESITLGRTHLSIPPTVPVPGRVTVHKEIRIIKSLIRDAGRGIAVQCDVQEQAPIFEIEEPLVTLVNNGTSLLMNTCDGCFDAKDKISGLNTTPFNDLEFKACTGCRVTYYCCKECQVKAWKQYHKYECKCLAELKELEFGSEGSQGGIMSGLKPVHLASYRFMVRLLKMDERGMVSEDQWTEIKKLNWHKALSQHSENRERAKAVAEHIMELTGTRRPKDLIFKVVLISVVNVIDMPLKLIRPWGKDYHWDFPFFITAGRCFDPFAALLNHSCDPNAFWYFEGRKLVVAAIKDIAAGDEIYISYINYSNYKVRQMELKDNWGFTCSCPVCLSQRDTVSSVVFHQLIQNGTINVDDMPLTPAKAGQSKELYDMVKFHKMIHFKNSWITNHRNGNQKEALRNCIKLNYLGSAAYPKPSVFDRLDVLYHMLQHIDSWKTEVSDFGFDHLKLNLRLQYAGLLEDVFSIDSHLVRYEMIEVMQDKTDWETKHGKEWIPFQDTVEAYHMFRKHHKLLMEWVGIPKGETNLMV